MILKVTFQSGQQMVTKCQFLNQDPLFSHLRVGCHTMFSVPSSTKILLSVRIFCADNAFFYEVKIH